MHEAKRARPLSEVLETSMDGGKTCFQLEVAGFPHPHIGADGVHVRQPD